MTASCSVSGECMPCGIDAVDELEEAAGGDAATSGIVCSVCAHAVYVPNCRFALYLMLLISDDDLVMNS